MDYKNATDLENLGREREKEKETENLGLVGGERERERERERRGGEGRGGKGEGGRKDKEILNNQVSEDRRRDSSVGLEIRN